MADLARCLASLFSGILSFAACNALVNLRYSLPDNIAETVHGFGTIVLLALLSCVLAALGALLSVNGVVTAFQWIMSFKRYNGNGFALYHHLTRDGEYHHHLHAPTSSDARITALITHSGWFRTHEIVSPVGDAWCYWKVTWASPFVPAGDNWITIQSIQVRDNNGIPWPSAITLPIEQTLRVMLRWGSAHAFVADAFKAKDELADLKKFTLPTLERERNQAQLEAKTERQLVDEMLKSSIRTLRMFETFRRTVGRTRHAAAIRGPLKATLALVADEKRLERLAQEVAEETPAAEAEQSV